MQLRKLRTFYRVWSGIEEARMRMVSNSIVPVCGSSLALTHDLAINDPSFTSWNFVPAGQMSVGGQSVSAYVILAGNTQLAIDVAGR